jgi:hypothetical protein
VRRGLPGIERYGAAAAVLAIVFFAGCGGDSSDSTEPASTTTAGSTSGATWTATIANNLGNGDQAQAIQALTAVFGSPDPVAACETHATSNYVTTAFGDVDGCKAAIEAGASSKEIHFSPPTINGDSASAVVTPSGGPSAGEQIHVTLVKDGDVWKVDSAKSDVPVGP